MPRLLYNMFLTFFNDNNIWPVMFDFRLFSLVSIEKSHRSLTASFSSTAIVLSTNSVKVL